jgi:hypothetical protein
MQLTFARNVVPDPPRRAYFAGLREEGEVIDATEFRPPLLPPRHEIRLRVGRRVLRFWWRAA